MKPTAFRITSIAAFLFAVGLSSSAAAPKPAAVPDLTAGGARDNSHDWTLGPTGARGWIWGRDLETTEARQILVTQVDKGSPADGVLEPGDVILGVDGRPFDDDARKAFGRAIAEAETPDKQGVLKLIRWRTGVRSDVTVPLRVMGRYSDMAPYDCPKSRLILEQGCRHLAARDLGGGVQGCVNALALLASGKPEYLDRVKAVVRRIAPPGLKLELKPGMFAWDWSYAGILLAEYRLATGDDSVLPALREYAVAIARGQSAVGTWGHGMSLPEHFGGLGGYGAINQPGLSCWLAMILAQRCGVDDPVVHKAVAKSREFFRFYINKGSIPYGDHPPFWDLHDNNGKNALAAIGFDLAGDLDGARFFSRLATAAYAEREYGHTGNYFSYLWGPLGARRSGPAAAAAHLKEQRWYYDLARRWDGAFPYPGGAAADDSYKGWDVTGLFLLTCALPLEKLYITGRGATAVSPLSGRDLAGVIADGRDFDNRHHKNAYDGRGEAQLLENLGSWSPTVRYRAALSLSRKPGDFVPRLTAMLRGESLDARLGACQALEYLGGKGAPAVDDLLKQLDQPDLWLQIRAVYALAGIGKPARKAVPTLLKMALVEDPKDPRDMRRRYLCFALFLDGYADNAPRRGLLADSLEGVDRPALYAAVRRMLTLEDGMARSQLVSVYKKLNEAELEPLWPDILRAVTNAAPSGEMFREGIRLAGLDLLARHRFQEGIRASLDYARTQNPWDSQERMWDIMKALKSYGAAARDTLPELRDLVVLCRNEKNFPEDCKKKKTAAVEDAIKAIEAATDEPPLRRIGNPPPNPGPD